MTTDIELYRIGETYIKFDFEYSENNKSLIKDVYLEKIGLISEEYFKREQLYKISIEFERGSLKTRIVIWGTAIYMGISSYGSFRTGVREIINDARQFSEVVINIFEDSANVTKNNILRTEIRKGLPGRLQELYIRIDGYERNKNNYSNVQQLAELNAIKTEIATLIESLPEQDKQAFLKELDNIYSKKLPQPNQRRANYFINRYGLKSDELIEFLEE